MVLIFCISERLTLTPLTRASTISSSLLERGENQTKKCYTLPFPNNRGKKARHCQGPGHVCCLAHTRKVESSRVLACLFISLGSRSCLLDGFFFRAFHTTTSSTTTIDCGLIARRQSDRGCDGWGTKALDGNETSFNPPCCSSTYYTTTTIQSCRKMRSG